MIRREKKSGKKVRVCGICDSCTKLTICLVLREIEQEDEAWEQSRRRKPKHGQNLEKDTPVPIRESSTDTSKEDNRAKSNAPVGFY